MKFILQNQRELQVAAFRNMEICLHRIIKRKDEEIAIAIKKKQEMEKLLRRQEAEKKELKRIAEKRGVMVIALHTKLKEEKKRARMLLENDVESCCDKNEEARAEKRIRRENDMMFCQKCKENSPSVLFLPCRHICSCQPCEALLEDCPICGMTKKGVIEIQNFI
jgi:E3 ubiquitin-protein ligase BOI-like protein